MKTSEILYVVFQRSDHFGPWNLLSPREFQHAWVFKQVYCPEPGLLSSKYTAKYELSSHANIEVWWYHPLDVAHHFLLSGVTAVLRYSVKKIHLPRYLPRGIMTCVSAIKPLLGISAWWVWTPYQLYNHLLGKGAERITLGGG